MIEKRRHLTYNSLETSDASRSPSTGVTEMKLTRVSSAIFPILLALSPASAQPIVHPFEPPPRLKELSVAPASLTAFFAKPTAMAGGCDPRGSVTRSGNIVNVDLSYIR